jgi:AraC family transcriptional regulator of adaptative response / DNA-3-methyladenine glycosylase II
VDTLAPPLPARTALDRARRSRDPRFDGRFFVGVTSTGVYCRPVCPAPSPRETHVRYFPTAAAAGEAGFRPCLRCRPEAAPGTPAWIGTSAVVRRALALVHEGALDGASVDALAARLGIGPRHLHRLFVAHVGAPPLAVAQTRRLHFAKRLIDETDLTMTEIAFASGFGSLRRFNDTFRKTYDRAPTALRRLRRTDALPPRGETSLRLAFRPPYDFARLLEFLAARAIPGIERVDATGYARTLALPSGPAVVRVGQAPRGHALVLRVTGAPASALLQLTGEARRVFDLAADPALIAAALGPDPLLGPLVRRRPGLRIPGAWDPFECAVRAVLGQQVSVEAGRTLARRLVARAGTELPRPTEGLTHLFPSPAALAGASLTGLGLTSARARALEALARAVADGRLDLRGPADEVTAGLVALPGIGDWTAQYVALRALGEPDAFPAGDLVLRHRAAGGGAPLTARALAARAEGWRPWRGYAVLHLWGAAAAAARRAPKRRREGE